jgi:hypothetical protein
MITIGGQWMQRSAQCCAVCAAGGFIRSWHSAVNLQLGRTHLHGEIGFKQIQVHVRFADEDVVAQGDEAGSVLCCHDTSKLCGRQDITLLELIALNELKGCLPHQDLAACTCDSNCCCLLQAPYQAQLKSRSTHYFWLQEQSIRCLVSTSTSQR